MEKIRLLDCTLRDGGFVNQWQFGKENIYSICNRLVDAGIDFVEIGYLRDYVEDNQDITEFSGTAGIDIDIKREDTVSKIVAIVDYGNCKLENIQDKCLNILDGIRVTFRKSQMIEAIEYCRKIKEKGYDVFVQPVSITDYTADDIIRLSKLVNELMPYAVCIVDTYGFMDKHWLLNYFNLMDFALDKRIALGYHAHNNLQLAYANAIELIEQFSKRLLIIDCSVFGMGKGAGNANTELMVTYLNENYDKDYRIEDVLEIADNYVEQRRGKVDWGYSLKYFLAASNKCHYKYIEFLLNKKTLSIKNINEIVSGISNEKSTNFDEDYIQELYITYQNREIDDHIALISIGKQIDGKPILLLASGNSIVNEKDRIQMFLSEKKPYVIGVNHYNSAYHMDAVFVSNIKRYESINYQLSSEKKDRNPIQIITSNLTPFSNQNTYVLNYEHFLYKEDPMLCDNSGLLVLNVLKEIKVGRVYLAGFDGYRSDINNYYKANMDFMNVGKDKNDAMKKAFGKMKTKMDIEFITMSAYSEED